MLNFDDLAPTVAARVEGCPHVMVVEALRDAAIDFCVRTRFHAVGHQVNLDGTQEPSFDLEQQVVDILQASIDGDDEACVHVVRLNDPIADDIPDGDYVLRFVDANNFEILPAPTLTAPITLNLLLVLAPGPDATGIHEDLWRRHREDLRSGALARLYAEPSKPWSSSGAADAHRALFERAVTKAAAYAGRNRTQPGRRLRVNPAWPAKFTTR
jgi:hypothetical protein